MLKPSLLTKVATLAALTATLGWHAAEATPAPRPDAPPPATARLASVPITDLEETFWACDHAATVGMIDAAERAICAAVTDELRVGKFGGDFDRMLHWWQANKAVEHRKLDRSGDANAVD